MQHLAIFVPWESFLSERSGDINAIWERHKQVLPRRISFLVDNIQLLHRSAEDAMRDARQWAAVSGETETDATADAIEQSGMADGDEGSGTVYRSDSIGNAARLIDVLRNAVGSNQVTRGSKEISTMVQQLCRSRLATLSSAEELGARAVAEPGTRTVSVTGPFQGANIPKQEKIVAIKTQQISASGRGRR